MGVGRARPLCCFFWIACCVVAAYMLGYLSPSALSVALLGTAAALVLLLSAALLMRRARYPLLYVFFLTLGLLFGLLASFYHENYVVRPANAFAASGQGEAVELQGLVTSHDFESNYANDFGMRIELPSGDTAQVYLSVAGVCDFTKGDTVRISAAVMPITDAPEQEWYIKSLRADGYTLYAYADGELDYTVLSREEATSWREAAARLQSSLSLRISRAIGGEEGRLVASLTLGTREQLSDRTTLDFRRAGASHLLALSGLHLSLVVLALNAVLRLLRCPYPVRVILVLLFAFAFLIITGCSISTLRAMVMLLWLYLSRLRGAPHDSTTALSAFLGVCLLLRPTWIYDAGLWLSVLATFAVVEIVPGLLRKTNEKKRPLVWRIFRNGVLMPLFTSCVVMIALAIPMALIFGEVSLFTPLSNLILTPLCALIVIGGLIALPLLLVAPETWVCGLATSALGKLGEGMLDISAQMSDARGALLSLRYDFVPYLLGLLLILFLLWLFPRWKNPTRFCYVLAGWVAMFAVCLTLTRGGGGPWCATYTTINKGELLMLNRLECAVLCDLSDGSYTTYRSLLNDGMPKEVTEVESLVLTHYHNRHVSSVTKLLGDCRVRTIWLPLTMPEATEEKAAEDESIARSIAAIAEAGRCEVKYYNPEQPIQLTETLSLDRLYYSMIKRSTHPTLALRVSYQTDENADRHSLTVIGASSWEGTHREDILAHLGACEALILSDHGPVVKTEYDVSFSRKLPTSIVCSSETAADAMQAWPDATAAEYKARRILADGDRFCFSLP